MGDLSSRAAIVGILVLVMIAVAGLALLIGRFLQKQQNESDFETVGFGNKKPEKMKKTKKTKPSKKKKEDSATELGDDFDDFSTPVAPVSPPQKSKKPAAPPIKNDGFIPVAGFQAQQPTMPPPPPVTPAGFGNAPLPSPPVGNVQPSSPSSSPFGSARASEDEDDW